MLVLKVYRPPYYGAEMNIFHEQFTLGQVADAIEANPETIKTWIKKGLIYSAPTEGSGPGSRRLHSFFGVMEMAVAVALINSGVKDNDVVFNAARSFAMTGTWPVRGRAGRVPGCPFHEGLTYVAIGNGRSTEICYLPGRDMMASTRSDLGGAEVIIFVEVNSIFRRVVAALGYDPVEVMKIAKIKGVNE